MKEPFFSSFHPAVFQRIYGSDHELGVASLTRNSSSPAESIDLAPNEFGMPRWLNNGGRVYIDCFHPEICPPETSNPLSAVVYEAAMRQRAVGIFGSNLALFANNRDCVVRRKSESKSFGAHESYSTSLTPVQIESLGPFLVARILLCGAGWAHFNNIFDLSQRAPFINTFATHHTQEANARGIICLRAYTPEDCAKMNRCHLILGDANINPIASFFRFGFTGLMLELAEMGELPLLGFNPKVLVEDLHRLSASSRSWIFRPASSQTDSWKLQSMQHQPSALRVLKLYHEQARLVFKGHDPVTDKLLHLLGETLDYLEDIEGNLEALSYRLDWASKLWFMRGYRESSEGRLKKGELSSIDLEYHRLGKDSLQTHIENQGLSERLYSPAMLHHALSNPPDDTRACFRGWLVRQFEEGNKRQGDSLYQGGKVWNKSTVMHGAFIGCDFLLFNPHDTYARYRQDFEERVSF